METPTPRSTRLHPLVAGAAISVIAVSALGAWALIDKQVSARHSDAIYSAVTDPQAAAQSVPPAVEAPAPAAPVAATPAVEKPVTKPAARKARPPAPAAQMPAPVAQAPVPTVEAANEHVPPPRSVAPPVLEAAPVCVDCGTVVAIREIKQPGQASGVGAVAGGVLGVVIGNQIGKGTGRDVARVLGGVGGAVAGHQVEKQVRTSVTYAVDVRMDDGTLQTVRRDTAPLIDTGARVRVQGGQLLHDDGSAVVGRAAPTPAAGPSISGGA